MPMSSIKNMMEMKGGEQKPREKSSFKVTCSLLSKYLKEKGRVGELGGLEKASRLPLDQQAKGKSAALTTISLLPGVDLSEDNTKESIAEQNSPKSMNIFPKYAGFESTITALAKEDTGKASIIKEMQKAQMTIFYAGKVLVFDNFPAEKAKELLQIASKESTAAAQNFRFKVPPSVTRTEENDLLKPANASDMPIARRNSLHRFIAKRKDRISTKAPYQVHGGSSSTQNAAKPEDSQGWLGLAPNFPKPEQDSCSSR